MHKLLDPVGMKMSRAERLIIILHYMEGMSFKDIGTTLDISESHVRFVHDSLLARVKAKLQAERDEKKQAIGAK
jgi:RNA polymerase sigma factor FliA